MHPPRSTPQRPPQRPPQSTQRSAALLAAVAGLCALVLALLGACASQGGTKSPPGGPLTDDVASAIIGTWRPMTIAGYTPQAHFADGVARATITFERGGRWHGSDGCNAMSGTYRLGRGGAISTTVGPSTAIGCANVPNGQVLGSAATAQVVGQQLTFMDGVGVVLGRYMRL